MQLTLAGRLRKRGFWIGLLLIVMLAAAPRLISYDFSLPYVDHPDEPNFYNTAQELRGLFDPSYSLIPTYPPGYIVLSTLVQTLIAPFGVSGLGQTLYTMRAISALGDLLTLIWIALSARLIIGKDSAGAALGGWVAGIAWGAAPLILENNVYALADPLTISLCALSIWLALVAQREPMHRSWCVGSYAVGLLAFLFKFPVFPVCLAGGSIALLTLRADRRAGGRFLAMQFGLTLLAFFLLFVVYGYSPTGNLDSLDRAGRAVRDVPLIARAVDLFYFTVYPLNAAAWLLVILLGVGAVAASSALRLPRIALGGTALILGLGVSMALATSLLAHLAGFAPAAANYRLRDVLPVTLAACILLGAAVGQLMLLIPRRFASFGSLLLIPLVVLVWFPQAGESMALANERSRPDTRVLLHRWFDQNLDPGKVVVYEENDKTFNPDYGGMRLCCGRWVEWFRVEDLRQFTPAEWRDAGLVYALIPQWQWLELQSTDDGRAYLADMLYLRTFADAALRGPATVVLRFTPPQQSVNIRFGDHLTLIGYDAAEVLAAGATAEWRFYWRASSTPLTNYNLFLHVIDVHSGELVAQADGSPAAPTRPTLTWDAPDETLISPPFQVVLPADLPAGEYQVLVGLYDYAGGGRLPAAGTDGALTRAGDAIVLAMFTVPQS